jgi:hypothetical protein
MLLRNIVTTLCDLVGWKAANDIQDASLGIGESSLNIAALVDTETIAPVCKGTRLLRSEEYPFQCIHDTFC